MLPLTHTIQTEAEYKAVQAAISRIAFGKPVGVSLTPDEVGQVELLKLALSDYQRRKFPLPEADLVDVVVFLMQQQGITPADLGRLFRSQRAANDFLDRKGGISFAQARQLHNVLGVPAELLLKKGHKPSLATA